MRIDLQRGFTLVEMIVVIVITGIIGGMVAMFMRAPVQGYVDSARRAEMTDIADTALRRMSRDIRTALPNSVRIMTAAGVTYLEFIPIVSGGRYRDDVSGGVPAGNPLNIAAADTSFDSLTALANAGVAAGDRIVVYNLGIAGASAYDGSNVNMVAAAPVAGALPNETTISFGAGAIAFPLDSCQPDAITGVINGCRYHVIRTPVTYACDPAAGTITRHSGYAIAAVQAAPASAGNLLATNVSACNFSYNANVVNQSAGLVSLALTITEQGESVSLYNAIHVNNVP